MFAEHPLMKVKAPASKMREKGRGYDKDFMGILRGIESDSRVIQWDVHE